MNGTASELLFVTKSYEISNLEFWNRDHDTSPGGIGIRDRSRFSRFVLLVIEKVMRKIRRDMTHFKDLVPAVWFLGEY